MGTDIRMHSQAKIDGKWQWYDLDICDDRNYELYGILSGTRGTKYEPIAGYKGFPEDSEDKLIENQPYDTDNVTKTGIDLGYAGISYLSLTELKTFDWTQVSEWNFTKEIMPYLEAVAERYGGPDNVRIVFGYSV